MNTMKNVLKTTLLATLVSGLSVTAFANNNHGGYIGAKVGTSLSDSVEVADNKIDTDKPMSYGVYGGYTWQNHMGVELEYNKLEDSDVKVNNTKIGDVSSDTIGLYGTYAVYPESMGNMYLKGKLGLVRADSEYKSLSGNTTASSDETGVGMGVGIGYDITPNFSVEGEYNYANVNGDMSNIGLGLKLKF